jgi:hypothetical protein
VCGGSGCKKEIVLTVLYDPRGTVDDYDPGHVSYCNGPEGSCLPSTFNQYSADYNPDYAPRSAAQDTGAATGGTQDASTGPTPPTGSRHLAAAGATDTSSSSSAANTTTTTTTSSGGDGTTSTASSERPRAESTDFDIEWLAKERDPLLPRIFEAIKAWAPKGYPVGEVELEEIDNAGFAKAAGQGMLQLEVRSLPLLDDAAAVQISQFAIVFTLSCACRTTFAASQPA